MDYRKLTKYVVSGSALALIGYDAFVISEAGTGASISMIIIEWSYKYPLVTLCAGILTGHLFWRVRDNKHTKNLGKDGSSSE